MNAPTSMNESSAGKAGDNWAWGVLTLLAGALMGALIVAV